MKAIVIWKRGGGGQESISRGSMSQDDSLDGFVLFDQISEDKPVSVSIYLNGLEDGKHGFHIHEKALIGDMLSGDTTLEVIDCCNKLGGHFNVGDKWSSDNPMGTPHGKHTGDLCMNIHTEKGMVDTMFWDDKISLFGGNNCIIGRSLVIHEDEDDLGKGVYEDEELNEKSKITGNAGNRVACGNIVKLAT